VGGALEAGPPATGGEGSNRLGVGGNLRVVAGDIGLTSEPEFVSAPIKC
jgi:hypothetical protein